ncbi:MAG: hypothetical protein NUV60_00925 [Patescibacteria group bacterium]|nr:hypothetical protein [Patescibacteria group bacterium]
MKNSHKGFVGPLVLVIIALLLAGGLYAYVYIQNKQSNQLTDVTTATQSTSSSETNSRLIPSVSLFISPTSITVGQAATVTLSTTVTQNCIGVDSDGTMYKYPPTSVFPKKTTEYTFTCYESPDLTGRHVTSETITVHVLPAPTSASSPYINTADIEGGFSNPDGIPYLKITGIGFSTSSVVHISGNGLDADLFPVSYVSGNGSNGTNITVELPKDIDIDKQYGVYITNGSIKSNTVDTVKVFRG